MATCFFCDAQGQLMCERHRDQPSRYPGANLRRCACCLRMRPVWLEHAGDRYCSYDCAETWAGVMVEEHRAIRGAALLAAAKSQLARERQAGRAA